MNAALYDTNLARPLTILVVDDHVTALDTISDVIEGMGHIPITSLSSESAMMVLSQEDIDIVLTDLVLTGESGLTLLNYIRRNYPDVPAILMSGHGTVETAVAALKDGALDFLVKPLDLTRLHSVINVAVRFRNMTIENTRLASKLREKDILDTIIGRSSAIMRVKQMIRQIAPSNATVLITGESGTGKELAAEAIHRLSRRASRTLVSINSATLSSELLESELFGHEKGSFTSAVRTKIGQFEVADGGTIFFDEIGDMPLAIQAKILRVLERRNFLRVGGTKTISVDVRVIAATNADLRSLISEGKFREDLYYRLNVIAIEMPPLRNMMEDLPQLISHFLSELNQRDSRNCSIASDALEALCAYAWPGNVRQMRNGLERAFLVAMDDRIQRRDLPEEVAERNGIFAPEIGRAPSCVGKTMDDIEKEAIMATLDSCAGNKSKAAAMLQIGLKTLYRKLEKWGEHEIGGSKGDDDGGDE